MEKNSVNITILGRSYKLVSELPEALFLSFAQTIDRDAAALMEKYSHIDAVDAAILSALEYQEALAKSRAETKSAIREVSLEKERTAAVQNELSEAQKKISEMNAELVMLADKYAQLKKKSRSSKKNEQLELLDE